MTKRVVIYDTSFDALAAAAVFYRFMPDALFITRSEASSVMSAVLDKAELYVVGLADTEALFELSVLPSKMVVVADTRTSHRYTVVADRNHSLCVSAWNYLYPETVMPKLLTHLDDRSSWRFSLPETKAIAEGLALEPRTLDSFAGLLDQDVVRLHERGQVVLDYKAQHVARFAENCLVLKDLWGYTKVPVTNVPRFMVAETLNMAADRYPIAVNYQDHQNRRYWSIRTVRPTINVGELCRRLGGNGKERSGGFTTTRHVPADLRDFLTKLYAKGKKDVRTSKR